MNLANINPAAVLLAFKNAAKMEAAGYTVEQDKLIDTCFVVNKNDAKDTFYIVHTFAPAEMCTCPQFAKVGFCKHQVFVNDYIALQSSEAQIAEYESREY